jgi:hypothetical protein
MHQPSLTRRSWCLRVIPALKGRAKFKPPLRGEEEKLLRFIDGRLFGQSQQQLAPDN